MLLSMQHLRGYTIQATDGAIGKVQTFYFDDASWVIRYLIADTGNWLPGKLVLIAPLAFQKLLTEQEIFPLQLTHKQIQESPAITADLPVSRQEEIRLHSHYLWPVYWEASDPLMVSAVMPYAGGLSAIEISDLLEAGQYNPHLRSMQEVIGYHIQATDKEFGHVEDFIVETASWTLRHVVIATRNWLPGKKLLVDVRQIQEVNWSESRVYIDLSYEELHESPEFDPEVPINRTYEMRAYDYYGRPHET